MLRIRSFALLVPALARPRSDPQVPAEETRHTERAATSAILWLANHQGKDGSWRFDPPVRARIVPTPTREPGPPAPVRLPWLCCLSSS